jgi:phage gp29-like protein
MELLEDMKARHVIVHSKDEEIDMLQMSGTGWELLDNLETKYRSTVMTLVLGANLTTSANSGGSYALAEVQENSTEARIQNDREMLEETLTEELIGCLWFKNRPNLVELGIAEEKPRFNVKQEKRLDPMVRAQVASTLNAMGVAVAASDLYEQVGFRQPEDGEPVIQGRQAMPAMGGGFGMDAPFGAGVPA